MTVGVRRRAGPVRVRGASRPWMGTGRVGLVPGHGYAPVAPGLGIAGECRRSSGFGGVRDQPLQERVQGSNEGS